jgi:hypothetical protein
MILGDISEKLWLLIAVVPTTYWGICVVKYSGYSLTNPLILCFAIGVVLVAIQAFYNYPLKIDLPDHQIQTHPEKWGVTKWFFISISWIYSLLTFYVLWGQPNNEVIFSFKVVYIVGFIIFALIAAFIFITFMRDWLREIKEEMNKNT